MTSQHRPTINPAQLSIMERALELVRTGMTLDAVAAEIGYSSGTVISGWRRSHPGFASALDAAKAEGLTLRPSHTRPVRILAAVRAGSTLRAALRAEGLTNSAVMRWRRDRPGFREELAAAMRASWMIRHGSPRARAQATVLTWIERGLSVNQACRRAGCEPDDVAYWKSVDDAFAVEYSRLIGPTHRSRGRVKFKRVLELVRSGQTVWSAADQVKVGRGAPRTWRDRYPELWAEVVQAYEDTGREPPRRRPLGTRERSAA